MSRSFLFLITFLHTSIILIAQNNLDFDKGQLLDEISGHVKTHFFKKTFDTAVWDAKVERCRADLKAAHTIDQFDEVVNKLLSTLNASHTFFFSRNNPKRFQLLGVFHKLYDQSDSSLFCYDGIGIGTKWIEGKFYIVSVYDGFPAAKAGLQFGDQIVSVDGKEFHPIGSFFGKTDSNVSIELIRNGEALNLEVPVVILDGRTMFEKALESSVKIIERDSKKIGYAHLWSYAGSKYHEILKNTILWGELSKCDALIVDLRDGWGGADINNLNLFRKPIAIIKGTPRDGEGNSYSGVWGKPVALLTNGRSTSGKELFAFGFKKLNLGKIVGETTAGAVVAGRIFKLSSGDVLYLAVNDVHVDGKRLEGVGVKPDVLIHRPILSGGTDFQLEKALELLSK